LEWRLNIMAHVYNSSTWEAEVGESWFYANLGKNHKAPSEKITKVKKNWRCHSSGRRCVSQVRGGPELKLQYHQKKKKSWVERGHVWPCWWPAKMGVFQGEMILKEL
jgi:hypothetical protein